ncbi:cupin domain-containing protein [Alteromonas sp. 5E99-2]|nr:cupin domain-containing protein [Alteromonas sp. 5E99-2]
MKNLNIDKDHFLAEVWQRKPLVIKKGIQDFQDPIDEHDLAGLAQDADIDSRIVSLNNNNWSVEQGPFDEFEHLCVGKWTLMVQGVDRWIEDINDLAKHFSFIPHWRFDDVMVSYSVPGAGVGPHVDQYDVFLIQGKGKRHWKVGEPDMVVATSPHKNLQQVEPFEPTIDVILEPGDILYIPPGFPHCGESIEPCLTYSVGFRAPNARDLLQPINEALFNQSSLPRYQDQLLSPKRQPQKITKAELVQLTRLVQEELQSSLWEQTLLAHLSDQSLPVEIPEHAYSEQEIYDHLSENGSLHPVLGCRPITFEQDEKRVFINGEVYAFNDELGPRLTQLISNGTAIQMTSLDGAVEGPNSTIVNTLTQLANNGILLVE